MFRRWTRGASACSTSDHQDFPSYLLCQQLSDFPGLEPELQQLRLQGDAALLPIDAGRADVTGPAAAADLQHVGHAGLCLQTRTATQTTQVLLITNPDDFLFGIMIIKVGKRTHQLAQSNRGTVFPVQLLL